MAKRKYDMGKRNEQQDETRQRIVEAAVHLHQTVGGQAATISRIAQEAGVERLTVYRHFPDERTLLTACTGHYMAQHPVPDPEPWAVIAVPEEALRAALNGLYNYYTETEDMMFHAQLDMPVFPMLAELLAPLFEYLKGVRDLVVEKYAREGEQQALLRAAVGHALDFNTWRSLVRAQGLDNAQAIEVMAAMVRCLAD